jgi:hypothetical protein
VVGLPVSIERRAAALCSDLSDRGFCLEVPFATFEQGRAIKGYVLMGAKELNFHGTVAWVKPGNPMTSMWSTMGVVFTQVSPGLRALIGIESKRQPYKKI